MVNTFCSLVIVKEVALILTQTCICWLNRSLSFTLNVLLNTTSKGWIKQVASNRNKSRCGADLLKACQNALRLLHLVHISHQESVASKGSNCRLQHFADPTIYPCFIAPGLFLKTHLNSRVPCISLLLGNTTASPVEKYERFDTGLTIRNMISCTVHCHLSSPFCSPFNPHWRCPLKLIRLSTSKYKR